MKPSRKSFYEKQMQEGRPGFVYDILAEQLQQDKVIEDSPKHKNIYKIFMMILNTIIAKALREMNHKQK